MPKLRLNIAGKCGVVDAVSGRFKQALVAPQHQGFHGHGFDRVDAGQHFDDETVASFIHLGAGFNSVSQSTAEDGSGNR